MVYARYWIIFFIEADQDFGGNAIRMEHTSDDLNLVSIAMLHAKFVGYELFHARKDSICLDSTMKVNYLSTVILLSVPNTICPVSVKLWSA